MSTSELVTLQTNEWHAARKLGVGGSEAASVFNEGFGCARALAYSKIDTPEDFPRTEREQRIMRRGTLMEELVADEYAATTGRKIRRSPTRVSKTWPWMRVNIDRVILGDPRGPGDLEVKTAAPWVFKQMSAPDPDTGLAKGMPPQYVLQLQHAMAVTGHAWGAFAVMNASTWELLTFEVERNEELIATIAEREQEFWQMVEATTLPAPLDKFNDRRCASCVWRRTCRGASVIIPDEDSELVVDESLAQVAADYAELEEKLEAYTEAKQVARELLERAIGDKPGVLIPSIGVKIRWKQQKGREGWDSKALTSLVESFRRIGAAEMASEVERCKKISAPTRPFVFQKEEQ